MAGASVAARSTAEWLALCAGVEIPAAKVERLEDIEDAREVLSEAGLDDEAISLLTESRRLTESNFPNT